MKEKFFRYLDLSIISILLLVLASALFYPVFRSLYAGIIYISLISFSVFLFIIRYKFSNETISNETPLDNLLFLIFCWYILSTIFATNKFNSLNATVAFSVLLAFYYIIHNYAKAFYKKFLWILFLLTVILSIYGIYQYFYGFNQTLNYLQNNPDNNSIDIINRLESNRIFSTFIYPNTFAGFLIMIIPITIGFIKNEKKYRLFLIPMLLLFISALLLTKSIGAFISLILSTLIIFFIIPDKSIRNFRIFLLYCLILFMVIFIFVIKERGLHDFVSNLSGKYSSVIKMFHISSSHLIFGAGPGNFEKAYNINNTSGYLKYAHNIIMQTLIELGIPGLFILLMILFSQYKVILQNFFFLKTPQSKIFITSLLISATAFLIHNLVDFDIYNFELAMVFILIVAILNSQIIIGSIEIKKIKLIYYLGLNPGKRRSIIFVIIILILGLSAVNNINNIYISSLINILIAAGFAIWSVSKEEIRRTELDVPVLIFILFYVISFFYTPDIYRFLEYLFMILTSVTVFYLYSQFLRRYVYKIIISNFLIITGIILSFIIIIFSILIFSNVQLPFLNIIKHKSDIVSLYLIIPFNFLLCRILFEKKINFQNLKISGLIVLLLTQLITASKTVVLLQLLIFIFVWIYYKKNKYNVKDTSQKESFKSNILRFIFVTIILLMVILFSGFNKKISLNKKEVGLSDKIRLFYSSIRMIYDKPLTGHGAGSFKSIFPLYNFPAGNIARYQNLYDLSGNELLQTGVSLGIPGIIIFLIIIFFIIVNRPEVGGHRKVWSASTGAYFSIIAILISCLFYNSLHYHGLLLTFVILAAMLSKEKHSISTIPKEALFFVKIYFFVPLIFAFIIFSFFIRPAIGKFLIENYRKSGNPEYLENAITIEPLNGKHFFEKGLIFENAQKYNLAIKNYKIASNLDKKNYAYFQYLGRCLKNSGDIPSAIKFYEKSIKYNPYNVFAYYELAYLYFSKLNNLNNAKEHIIKCLEYEPNFVSAKHLMALILTQEENKIEALSQYNEIEEILGKYKPITEYDKSLLDFRIEILYLNKALILKDTGDFERALYYFEKYYELSKDENIKKTIIQLNKKGIKN